MVGAVFASAFVFEMYVLGSAGSMDGMGIMGQWRLICVDWI